MLDFRSLMLLAYFVCKKERQGAAKTIPLFRKYIKENIFQVLQALYIFEEG